MITFTIPGNPIPKGRPRFRNVGKFVRTYTPQKTLDYESKVRTYWKSQSGESIPQDYPISLRINAFIEMPKSWSKKKKADMDGKPHQSKPDIDNVVKAIADALNGYAYEDDSSIYTIVAQKIYSYDPKVIVSIYGGQIDEEL